MYKKISIVLLFLTMALMPISNVFAESQNPILIENLVYTVTEPASMPDFVFPEEGQLFYAEGQGIINCNGRAICESAGLNGESVTFQQGFKVEIEGVDAGHFTASTAGKLHLPGEFPAINFAGQGDGVLECVDEICDLTMELETQTNHGSHLSFSLVAIDIDHTSAGIVCDTFGGLAELDHNFVSE